MLVESVYLVIQQVLTVVVLMTQALKPTVMEATQPLLPNQCVVMAFVKLVKLVEAVLIVAIEAVEEQTDGVVLLQHEDVEEEVVLRTLVFGNKSSIFFFFHTCFFSVKVVT